MTRLIKNIKLNKKFKTNNNLILKKQKLYEVYNKLNELEGGGLFDTLKTGASGLKTGASDYLDKLKTDTSKTITNELQSVNKKLNNKDIKKSSEILNKLSSFSSISKDASSEGTPEKKSSGFFSKLPSFSSPFKSSVKDDSGKSDSNEFIPKQESSGFFGKLSSFSSPFKSDTKDSYKENTSKGDNPEGDTSSQGISKEDTPQEAISKEKSSGFINPVASITSLFSFIGKESPKEDDDTKKKPTGFFASIKSFLKKDYYFFMKNYLYFMVLFSICFYLLLYVNDKSKIKSELVITKIFFYIVVIFLFIIIGDIIEIPLEFQNKLLIIILFSLLLVYLIGMFINYYYKKEFFYSRIFKIFLFTILIYIITLIIIHYTFKKNDTSKMNQVYSNFSLAINKNILFLLFMTYYLFIYSNIFYFLHLWNSGIAKILGTSLLGLMLLLFVFIFIIYITLKMKIINKNKILNTFIVLTSIAVFLSILYAYIFMSSLSNICNNKVDPKTVDEEERMSIFLLISIFIILWYDDSRNWHALGSLLFIIATIFGLYCFFYYSMSHPNLTLLGLWFFIEWLIIIFYRKQNSKNAIHFSFMQI